MRSCCFFRTVPFLLVFFCAVANSSAYESLESTLKPYLADYRLPALAAAVVSEGKIVSAGAVGTRRAGADIPVRLDDRFHIGSDTKAITALLAAILVESNKLRWDSTVAEVFPEIAGDMDHALKKATLQQLLSHSSGLPSDNEKMGMVLEKSIAQGGNLDSMRYWLVRQWSAQPLASEPGKVFAYSNMGYLFAGAMIERATGRTWEELVAERIFDPLGLESAGFGPPARLGRIDAPVGHAIVDGETTSFLPGPNGDNWPILGPAGTAHMSVLDFARWAAWNAGEGKRGPKLVLPATLKKLHTPVIAIPPETNAPAGAPPVGKYCLGWGEIRPDWAYGPLLTHTGSNTKNLAMIIVEPGRDFAMVLMTNIAGEKADAGLKALSRELYKRSLTSGMQGGRLAGKPPAGPLLQHP